MKPPFATEEEFAKAAMEATYRGFIATLNGGVPHVQVVKAATANAPEELSVAYRDLTDKAKSEIFQKYAKVWLPHRQEAASGYVKIIQGQAA
jgi:hypothetical protein